MPQYVCVHGHFYQPPRENPWLEAIELQDSAYPHHDWNERITAECYAPNADARILDGAGRIVRIVNNYARISFNYGPTLLAWLEQHAPGTYTRVLEADRESAARFGGYGSALAQAYNHVIQPLANTRDQYTQVRWGIEDFRHRFGRDPDGMWLPETAVDTPSLEVLAACGIRFTILAPHQAAAVRPLGTTAWQDVTGGKVDPRQPYLCQLPSGRTIVLFFYDGPASRAVAFEGLLKSGDRFAHRLLELFRPGDEPQLAHIATDGESYGHHHRHGDMALAYALRLIEEEHDAHLTNYTQFLALHPPTFEVQIIENSSWSCAHGIERWRSDCGCHTGGSAGWHQRWRAPLRAALDWLRDTVALDYERYAAELLSEPWAARDDYIAVVLDRSERNVDGFLARNATRSFTHEDQVRALELLELQRHAMLMYTSCGWFFNEVSGIETVQVLQYAARVVQLGERLFDRPLEAQFLELLEAAESNLPEFGNARIIYERQVRPTRVDLMSVAAHHAVSSLFDGSNGSQRIFAYAVQLEHHEQQKSGDATLAVGRARITSEITRQCDVVTYALLHFGSHSFSGGIRRYLGEQEYDALAGQMIRSFGSGDLTGVIRLLAEFPEYSFSIKSLFADRQREILYKLLQASVRQAERAYRGLYRENAGLIRFLIDMQLPLPRAFSMAAEFVINRELRRIFESETPDLQRARTLVTEANELKVTLDEEGLSYVIERTLERLAAAFRHRPHELDALEQLVDVAAFARSLPFSVDLGQTQNHFYGTVHDAFSEIRSRAEAGDRRAQRALPLFRTLGEQLSVAVP
jgi:alpha-amylase/alpha-mannosidase (GH57 family)